MAIAEGISMSMPSDSSLLASALVAVLAAGRAAFPGWPGTGLWRWIRGAVLVGTWTYVVLAGALLYVTVAAARSGTKLADADALLAQQITALSLFLLPAFALIHFIAKASTPPADPPNDVPKSPLWPTALVVMILATTAADSVAKASLDPLVVVVMWLLMTATYVGYESYTAATARVSARVVDKRRVRAAERLRDRYGERLGDWSLIGIGPDGQVQQIGRVLTVIDGQGTWIEREVAGTLEAWFRSQPLGALVGSSVAEVTFRESWLHDASLTLRHRNGETEAFLEERQRAHDQEIRGFPVGLIRVRRADLERLGLCLVPA
jgi:hypothetical protein